MTRSPLFIVLFMVYTSGCLSGEIADPTPQKTVESQTVILSQGEYQETYQIRYFDSYRGLRDDGDRAGFSVTQSGPLQVDFSWTSERQQPLDLFVVYGDKIVVMVEAAESPASIHLENPSPGDYWIGHVPSENPVGVRVLTKFEWTVSQIQSNE